MRNLYKVILIFVLGLFLSISSVNAQTNSITINEGFFASYVVGNSFKLSVSIDTDNSNTTVEWSSYVVNEDDSSETLSNDVLTVDKDGNVKVVGEGIGKIEAKYDGLTASYYVLALEGASVSFNDESKTMQYGESTTLSYTLISYNQSLSFSSSNSNIVSVNSNGVVTAKGVGTATITASIGNSKDTITVKVSQKDISKLSVKGVSNRSYTGYKRKPAVTVKYGSTTLKEGIDYTLYYSNNLYPGKATIKIVGKGKYTGTKYTNFNIVPANTYISYIKSNVKKKITVKYPKRIGASGYIIAYKKYGTSNWAYKYTTSTSYTITGLTSKKKYQVRVIPYKTIDNKKVNALGWSSTKTVTVR